MAKIHFLFFFNKFYVIKFWVKNIMEKKPEIKTKSDVPPVIKFPTIFSGKVSITQG
jgi:hypothetical protein